MLTVATFAAGLYLIANYWAVNKQAIKLWVTDPQRLGNDICFSRG